MHKCKNCVFFPAFDSIKQVTRLCLVTIGKKLSFLRTGIVQV